MNTFSTISINFYPAVVEDPEVIIPLDKSGVLD
jgi:hypothetical protein